MACLLAGHHGMRHPQGESEFGRRVRLSGLPPQLYRDSLVEMNLKDLGIYYKTVFPLYFYFSVAQQAQFSQQGSIAAPPLLSSLWQGRYHQAIAALFATEFRLFASSPSQNRALGSSQH